MIDPVRFGDEMRVGGLWVPALIRHQEPEGALRIRRARRVTHFLPTGTHH